MTRDEASAKVAATGMHNTWLFVDALAALGLLKLDEPMTVEKALAVALSENGYAEDVVRVGRRLNELGFEIVRKKP